MTKIIVIIAILIAAMYVYTFFITRKRRRKPKIKSTGTGYKSPYENRFSSKAISDENNSIYNNYVTKYNSQEDYREVTPPDFQTNLEESPEEDD